MFRVLIVERRKVLYATVILFFLVGLAIGVVSGILPVGAPTSGRMVLTAEPGGGDRSSSESAGGGVADEASTPASLRPGANQTTSGGQSSSSGGASGSQGVSEASVDQLQAARVQYDYYEQSDALASRRFARDYVRSQEIELLQEAVSASSASSAAAEEARQRLVQLAADMEKESTAEGLICARGYSSAVVYLSDGSVDAVIASKELTRDEVAAIGSILTRVTGAKLHQIRISEQI